MIRCLFFRFSGFCLCCGVLSICRDLNIILYGCVYELMTWLLEVYAIFPLWCFIVEIFMHVSWELFEDVTSISWIFIIFAWFIALIEVGRYKCYYCVCLKVLKLSDKYEYDVQNILLSAFCWYGNLFFRYCFA